MKYANARDILPPSLLRLVQRYAAGQLLYIPAPPQKRAWGESSGYKRYLVERNREIKARFQAGESLEGLADGYALSLESIKRIVYNKKEEYLMEYRCTLSSAQECARHGQLEDWVHAYLLSDGHNRDFSDGLKLYERRFLGPVRMPLALFERCCGPEESMRWRVDAGWFEKHVEELMRVVQTQPDMPPLIVHYLIPAGETEGVFELNDGNHRLEAYKRLGVEAYWAVVWITEPDEYEQFMQRYGTLLAGQD